jgi:hypothetical protein
MAALLLPLLALAALLPQIAGAEGSRELTTSDGDRPYTEFRNDTNAGVLRRTTIRVFVREGETLNLGSSAVGVGAGRIDYRRVGAAADENCGAAGVIASRAQELAGPLPTTDGYTPCTVTVGTGEGGIWEIRFVSPNQANTGNPPPIAADANWESRGTHGQVNTDSFVTAWDVTVRGAGGVAIPGRGVIAMAIDRMQAHDGAWLVTGRGAIWSDGRATW